MRATYDNSSSNPRNPHRPPRDVVWGQNTSNEMADLWLQVIPVSAGDAARLGDDIDRKIAAANLAAFTRLVEREPRNAQVREQLALQHLQAGRVQEALVHFRELVALKPEAALGYYNLGNALSMNRQYDEAVRAYQQALALDPNLGEAHTNLGAMLSMQGRPDEGLRHFLRAVELQPDSAEAQANLARSLVAGRRPGEAVPHFQTAIDLRPDLVSALVGLAWIRAEATEPSLRNAADAVRLAERAVALTRNRDASALDVLAAAYAAAGRIDQAIATARLAIDTAAAVGATALAADIRTRLAAYEGRRR
jgi:tetratricopeptide (TPR) repeat protein